MNSNYYCKKQYIVFILFFSFITTSFGQIILSDKSDYYPGELATFTGSGFAPNEIVDLVVLHADETPNTGENHEHWEVQADSTGAFVTTWIVCTDDCLGSTLRAYATGLSSGFQAWVEFTDANVRFTFSGITGYSGSIILNYRVYSTIGGPTGSFTQVNITYPGPGPTPAIAVSNSQTIQYNTNLVIHNSSGYTSTPGSAVGANNGSGQQLIPIAFTNSCTAPTISCPANVNTSTDINSCIKSVPFAATASGTTPTITYKIGTTTITSPHNFPLGVTTVTATATNDCGSASCSFTVTVSDTTPPSFTKPADITIYTNSTCGYNSAVNATGDVLNEADNCSSGLNATFSDSVANGSCLDSKIITRTWSLVDDNGNAAVNQTQIITVLDNIPPVAPDAPATASYQCLADVPSAGSLSAQDNCSGEISADGQDSIDNSNPCHVVITRTWTFTDACNNSSSISQTINVIDDMNPVAPDAPATASYQCLADVPSAGSLSAQDNCSGEISAVGQDSIDNSNPCHVVITRTWTFTDACSNSSSISQTINVIDDMDPVAPDAPATASYQCLADVPSAGSLSAQDNCSGVISADGQDSIDNSNPCHVVITRTWTFTDACSNSSSVSQIINVIDDMDPVAPNAPVTASYQCLADVPSAGSLSAQDNCSGEISAVGQDSIDNSNPCHVVITRTWTFTDACSNSSSVSQIINVIDDMDPVAPDAPATASYQCLADVPSAGSLSAQDNCSGEISAVGQDSIDNSNPCHVVITRTWTFTDACSNSSSVSQTINVIDDMDPVAPDAPATASYQCLADVPSAGSLSAQDNCSGVISADGQDSIDNSNPCHVVITRIWTFTDACSNSSSISQIINVIDTTIPTFTKPADITIYTNSLCGFDSDVSITGDVSNEADNCSTGLNATFSDSVANGTCQGSKIITRTWSLVDNCNNAAENQTQIITVLDNTPPSIGCPANQMNLTTDSGLCTKTLTAAQIGYPTFSETCSTPVITFIRSDNQSVLAAPFDLGITTITWTATDNCNNQTSCTQTIQVNKIATAIVVSTNVNTQQYSDLVNFSAQLTTCSSYPICGTVTFKLGTTVLGVVNVNSSGLAELPNIPMLFAPNNYIVSAEYSGCSPSYLSISGTSNLAITCEDALAYYTGSSYVSTSSATSSSATVTLSATIKDISAEPNLDTNFGNITNAKVTFINKENGSVIASNIPIGLVSVGDTKVGTATYNWNTTISGDSQTITIGIIVTGYYCRDLACDNSLVTISKPLGDLFITGGGYLTLTNSSGIKASTTGTKNNYGFNVKYNKNKTSLQGNINTIIRRMESDGLHVYQVKGNSMTSLTVNTNCPKKAVFVGKANIQDITNPLNVIAVDGNATLQVTMTDYGEPGNNDQIAITVWNKLGGLWYASNWNGTTTIEQTISGGNLKVHGGQACNNSVIKVILEEIIAEETEKPEFKIWPNPSANEFNLDITNKVENQPTLIEVFDQSGRLIQKFTTEDKQFQFGNDLHSGLYFIQISNGKFQESKQIIKH